MTVLRSILMAFTFFSAIPVPQLEWDPRGMRYLLAALPLVGAVVGLCAAAWYALATWLGLGSTLVAAGMTLVPVIVSGGVHHDGLIDVIDAQCSNAEPARKREILKDPHIGAFSVIWGCCFFLAYFGICSELAYREFPLLLLCAVYPLARTSAAFGSLVFPKNTEEGLLTLFSGSAHTRKGIVAVIIQFLVWAAAVLYVQPLAGGAMIGAQLALLAAGYAFSHTQFKGMSGDLAGAGNVLTELGMLAALLISLVAGA